MKYRIMTVAAFAAALLLPATAFGAKTCEEKAERIQKELKIAKEYGNKGRIRGLEKALSNVNTWCDNDDLKDDAAAKVKEKEEKVRERQAELNESTKDKKDAKKLAKRKLKLEEAKEELAEAKAELESFTE